MDLLLKQITPELQTQMCAEIDKGWKLPESKQALEPRVAPGDGIQDSDTRRGE
jgi:hypothetical protein